MRAEEVRYMRECIDAHVRRFFSRLGRTTFDECPIRWLPTDAFVRPLERAVFISTDVPASSEPGEHWRVPFGASALTVWNRLAPPSAEWECDAESRPLWYRHPSGAVTPAWNLAPTLFDLLTLREERATAVRDVHGRFTGAMSPRRRAGLLQSPIFNDAVAALVAACDGLSRGSAPSYVLRPELLQPPALVLSHDLDQLRGNDVWTQVARLSRVVRPRHPGVRLRNLLYAGINAIAPQRYYFDNIVGMIAVERMLGFSSTLYFLNGRAGRLGARSGPSLIPAAAALAPNGWSIGMHYNYDTFLDAPRFRAQRSELEHLLGGEALAGRAHYLRFDDTRSWRFLASEGIRFDESLGYPDEVGYRAGIAGPFTPFDVERGESIPMLEMPMIAMESTLTEGGPAAGLSAFSRMFTHLAGVGGAMSVLFHPGQFHNPEFPETLGVYRRVLGIARDLGARSVPSHAWLG